MPTFNLTHDNVKLTLTIETQDIPEASIPDKRGRAGPTPKSERRATLTPPARRSELKVPVLRTGRGDFSPGVSKPLNFAPAALIKECRPGTKRAKAVALLRKGTTIPKVMKATGWSKNDAREGIRQIHYDLGYGLKEADGIVTLVEK